MKFSNLFLIGLLALLACKKEKTETLPPTNQEVFLYDTKGSYFVYEIYKVDSNGIELNMNTNDTVRIMGDTMLQGNMYVHYTSSLFGNGPRLSKFLRDSSGYIVSNNGDILYSKHAGEDTVLIRNYGTQIWEKIILKDSKEKKFNLPSGHIDTAYVAPYSISCYPQISILSMKDSSRFSPCGQEWVRTNYFANGFGELKTQFGYLFTYTTFCTYYERRLSYYYIAPE